MSIAEDYKEMWDMAETITENDTGQCESDAEDNMDLATWKTTRKQHFENMINLYKLQIEKGKLN